MRLTTALAPDGDPTAEAVTRPEGPRAVLGPTGALFGALARARHDRSMHGPGIAFRCRVELAPPPGFVAGAPFFEEVAAYRATIRFSRGIGLPQPAADLLGIAVRVQDAHGPGRPQDLLVTSSGRGRIGRRLLLPARDGFFGQWFSSVLPYRVGSRRTLLGVRALTRPTGEGTDLQRLLSTRGTGELSFGLALAHDRGWTRTGTIHVDDRLPDDEATALTYDPWTTGGGISPVGIGNRLRAAAYPGSRRARGAG